MTSKLLFLAGLFASGTTTLAQTYTFTTFAGRARTAGNADGAGEDAQFHAPHGLATDGAGNIYVADLGNHTVRKITPAGTVSKVVNAAGNSFVLSNPIGVTVDKQGNIYIADVGNVLIVKASPTGTISALGGGGRFDVPTSVAVDDHGNVFITDSVYGYLTDIGNNAIRKIAPGDVVTTLAGKIAGPNTPANLTGSTDGTGSAASFSYSFRGIAVDPTGHLYVADTGNATIRKVSPAGVVTTFAGQAGLQGTTDGTGAAARFREPRALALDAQGNLFVADETRIRVVAPDGTVITLRDARGEPARFAAPGGIAVDLAGHVYVSDAWNQTIHKGVVDLGSAPRIEMAPASQIVSPGGTAVMSVEVRASPRPIFQWTKDGAILAGATNAELFISDATTAKSGSYACVVTNALGSVTSSAATLTLSPAANSGRIVNFSIRARTGSGSAALGLGLTISGGPAGGTKPVLVRAAGPALASFGLSGVLADPQLTLYAGNASIDANDNWSGDPQISAIAARAGAFPFAATTSTDAALYRPALLAGNYSVFVTGLGDATGAALAEVYDATPTSTVGAATPRFTNISARVRLNFDGDKALVGFVVSGETSRSFLIRAAGPALSKQGVGGSITDTRLRVFSGSTQLRENDNWGDGPAVSAETFAAAGAFPFPDHSNDSALVVTLPPGIYAAEVENPTNYSGITLVEIYELP